MEGAVPMLTVCGFALRFGWWMAARRDLDMEAMS
jgi:hypothetical protein